MANRWIATLLFLALTPAIPAQESEFATTAPAKILLPIDEAAPVPSEEMEATPPAPGMDSEAPIPPPAVDPLMEAIGAEMAEQDNTEATNTSEESSTTAMETGTPPSATKAAVQAVQALCAVLILILLLYAAAKRWGKGTPLLAGQQLARVLGRVGLSPQASLHFVQTNGEVLVIGVTQHQVSLLRTFDAEDFAKAVDVSPEKASPTENVPTTTFLDQLKESRAAMGVEAAVDNDLDQLKGELQRLKQYFQDNRS